MCVPLFLAANASGQITCQEPKPRLPSKNKSVNTKGEAALCSFGGERGGRSDGVCLCPCVLTRRSRTRRPCRQRCVTCGSTTGVCRRSRGRRPPSCAGSPSGSSAPLTKSRSPCAGHRARGPGGAVELVTASGRAQCPAAPPCPARHRAGGRRRLSEAPT